MIRVLYFARLRDRLGTAGEEIADLPGTVGELLDRLTARGDDWAEALSGRVLMAVNQEMADRDTPLADGDEVGFFPPVTGG